MNSENVVMKESTKEWFKPADIKDIKKYEQTRPSLNYWQDVWQRFKQDKMAFVGLVLIIIVTIFAIFGPMISPFEYDQQDFSISNQWPTLSHPFGTDMFGRDIFVRVMYGARISLSIGFVASIINLTIGVIYGGISGLIGGKVDNLMMRFVDVLYSIPTMIFVILLMVVIGPGLKSIFITLGISYWVGMARIVRAEVLRLKQEEFILAAKVLGTSPRRILFSHILPNAMGPILVTLTLSIPSAIFTEAFLSFVGLGVSAPAASWGVLVNDAVSSLEIYPFQLFFPAAAICITILAFNFLGDGLRDALDPKLRK